MNPYLSQKNPDRIVCSGMLLRALPGLLRATQAPQALSVAFLHTTAAVEQPVAKAAESSAKPALVRGCDSFEQSCALHSLADAHCNIMGLVMCMCCSSRSFRYIAGPQIHLKSQSMYLTRWTSTGEPCCTASCIHRVELRCTKHSSRPSQWQVVLAVNKARKTHACKTHVVRPFMTTCIGSAEAITWLCAWGRTLQH